MTLIWKPLEACVVKGSSHTHAHAGFSGPELIQDGLMQNGIVFCGLTSPRFKMFWEIAGVVAKEPSGLLWTRKAQNPASVMGWGCVVLVLHWIWVCTWTTYLFTIEQTSILVWEKLVRSAKHELRPAHKLNGGSETYPSHVKMAAVKTVKKAGGAGYRAHLPTMALSLPH